jgi:NAD(P) transhydrogenase subunit alpha
VINIDTITIFILACFVGYYVVLKVTPALHAPLMSVTNAISSVIIVVGLDVAIINACTSSSETLSSYFGMIAVFLTMINIVGGIMLTQRMLEMFSKKKKGK